MVLDREALFSSFEPRFLERGLRLFRAGAVRGLELFTEGGGILRIKAEVGSESVPGLRYAATIILDRRGLCRGASCDCPVDSFCKHAAALAFYAIDTLGGRILEVRGGPGGPVGPGGPGGAEAGRVLPNRTARPSSPPGAPPPGGREEVERIELRGRGAGGLPPALASFPSLSAGRRGELSPRPQGAQAWALAFAISAEFPKGGRPSLRFWRALRYVKKDGSLGRLAPWKEGLPTLEPGEEDLPYLDRFGDADSLLLAEVFDLLKKEPPRELHLAAGRPEGPAKPLSLLPFKRLRLEYLPIRWEEARREPSYALQLLLDPGRKGAEPPLEGGAYLAALAPGALCVLAPERGLLAYSAQAPLVSASLAALLNWRHPLAQADLERLFASQGGGGASGALEIARPPREVEIRRMPPRAELRVELDLEGGFLDCALFFLYGEESFEPELPSPEMGGGWPWREEARPEPDLFSREGELLVLKRRNLELEEEISWRTAELLEPFVDLELRELDEGFEAPGRFPLALEEEGFFRELAPLLLDAGLALRYRGRSFSSIRRVRAQVRLSALGDCFEGSVLLASAEGEEFELEDPASVLDRGYLAAEGPLLLIEPENRAALALLLERWDRAKGRILLPKEDFGRLEMAAALSGEEGRELLAERLALGRSLASAFGSRGKGEEVRPIPEEALPEGLLARLRPYQKEGYDRLCFMYDQGLAALLADDMGLGKTIQTLALLLRLKLRGELGLGLLVAPLTLLPNWEAEAARFTPGLRLLRHHGPARPKSLEAYEGRDLILTTYQTLRADRALFESRDFGFLALDEAQAVKNPDSASFGAARAVRARRRLSITGTPVENRPLELWSQFELILPGLLDSRRRFESRFSRPIAEEGDAEAARLLRGLVAPFIIRRRKEDVLADLPPKEEILWELEMGSRQAAVYERLRAELRSRLERSFEERGKAKSSIAIFEALLRLRQAAIHPGLISPAWEGAGSIKFDFLSESLVELAAEGHRILVFSQFVEVLKRVEALLPGLGLEHQYLDGSTRDRKSVIERFRRGADPVFLLSLKAGGLGINLPEADYVVLLDPWWNPAVESQAADRVHRIGQTRPVTILKPIVAGSVEERILALQERKRELVAELVAESGSLVSSLSEEEILGLFR